ncbi:BMP family ABC transporter substrate-binding protein [Streptomyces sp. NPDC006393]|uniref:BMP family ABC transporter substrate-binding protein n=1 Tax=Streptomyces sp. NPDC006393 TaxID=3156763 RepID=UPI0033F9260F
MKVRRTWRRSERDKKGKGGSLWSRVPVARVTAVVAVALRGRRGRAVAGVVAAVALALVGVRLFGGEESGPPDPRARQYTEIDACLLTGEKGIVAGTTAATVWQGMREASLDTRARVTYVPVMGPQTADNVRPFFNSLMQRQCEILLAVGDAQVEVARADAGKHPQVRFVVVGGETSAAGNIAVAKPDVKLKDTIAEDVRQAVRMVKA